MVIHNKLEILIMPLNMYVRFNICFDFLVVGTIAWVDCARISLRFQQQKGINWVHCARIIKVPTTKKSKGIVKNLEAYKLRKCVESKSLHKAGIYFLDVHTCSSWPCMVVIGNRVKYMYDFGCFKVCLTPRHPKSRFEGSWQTTLP